MKRMIGNIKNAINHLPPPSTTTPIPKVMPPPTERQIAFQEKVDEMIENARFLIHAAPEHARVRRAMYNSYINEGFTPQQAIELLK
jgi:hypothetical protein